ncbi:MAG: KpsF/GutQ family sugar-phosphate isomerase [Bacteroidales bacterium]|nr:KpsF/GutQ family sugar-phosphate isomerase [Bacteroidales bacterium]
MIYKSRGRVVVTGIGKSAHIASKIVATFNSTGTSSVFMHAADAIHGDLGMIRTEDIVIIISKSGETPEIKVLVPLIKSAGNPVIAIVGNKKSYLARQASKILDVTIEKEACQNNLAPTTSTTAQLVMGDALAVALIEVRDFSSKDFARFHPGGTLGKRLYLRVKDLFVNNEMPVVLSNESMDRIILEISSKRLGATAVLENNKLVGIITDGDLRRMLQKHPDYRSLIASDVMTANPRTIQDSSLVVDALTLMKENNITQLPVLKKEKYVGVIHLHDILKEGIL